MSKEFIYTAITRATKFGRIYYVTGGPRYSWRKRKQVDVDDAQQKKAATLLQARHRGTAARRKTAKLAAAKQGEAERKAAPSVDLTAV